MAPIEALAVELESIRAGAGRLFIAGMGGSAANASHAASDFRKLCGIQAFCLSDNVAELTARANDEGLDYIYHDALTVHRAATGDALLILSVGGGCEEVSRPLVSAMTYAETAGMSIYGIVGRDGGETAKRGKPVVIIPPVCKDRVTPHTEAFQMVIIHLLVSHPLLQKAKTKW